MRAPSFQQDSISGYPPLDEAASNPRLQSFIVSGAKFEEQPSGSSATKNGGPKIQSARRKLGRMIEAAECKLPRVQYRQRSNRWRILWWTITGIAVRHPQDRFRIPFLFVRPNMEAIGDQVIDRREASGARVTDPRDLHGSRFAGKDQQSTADMPLQIDKNIDFVRLNLLCQ